MHRENEPSVAGSDVPLAPKSQSGNRTASQPTLHILHLEDDRDYVELVRSLLEVEGLKAEVMWVDTRENFQAALERGGLDLIIADYALPTYNGIAALQLAREKRPETPFLLVSGTIGEEAAIESLKNGATDYVLKHWPERLGPAVRRAVKEANERARRLHAETELVRRENYFRSLTENALDIITILDGEGVVRYTSPSATRVLGRAPEQLAGQNIFALVHPDDRAETVHAFQYGLEHPDLAVTLQARIRHADGSWRYLEAVGQNRIADPEIAGVVVNSRDITERKREEHRNAAVSDLGQRLSSATSPEAAARIIGEVTDDALGWDCFTIDLYCPKTDEIEPLLNIDIINGQRTVLPSAILSRKPSPLARRIMSTGAELILHSNQPTQMPPDVIPFGDTSRPSASLIYVPIRNRTEVIGILSVQSYRLNAYTEKDVTTLQALADHCGGALERMRTEEALRQSEKQFRHLFENSPDAVFVEDFNGTVLDANLAACQLHGLTRETLVGKNISELVPPAQRDEVARIFKKLVDGEFRQIEGVSCTADGRFVPVEVRTSRIDYSGQPALLLHVRDISERKNTEEALRCSEMRFHSVWENSVDGMRLTDENGIIVSVNEAYCTLIGMKREELEGKLFTTTYAETENLEQHLQHYRQRFREHTVEKRFKRRLTFRAGKAVDLEVTNSFVELQGEKPLLLGLFRDITEQKRLEDQLRHSQKMDAIGQLAGGVAHDFNNILTVIHGHASLLLASGNLSTNVSRSAQQISQSADRAAGLTRQLLTFSRRQVIQPKRLDLNEVVGNMVQMLNRLLGEHITLLFNYSPNPPLIRADVGMMEQVLLNLAINARDAMPQGGELTIKISVQNLSAEDARQHPDARAGRFTCLSVSDSGCGITPVNLRRIFEPFFTTKEVGKGTGLGLATVYGIVQQHQGWIEVASEVGIGTSFAVFLPAAHESVEAVEGKPAEPAASGGTESILVVEDEAPVRELVCNVLRGYGYQVQHVPSGVKALEVWEQRKDRIDLVLTDIVMPDGLTGRDLAEKLRQEKAELKVIFTSGYSADIVGKDFVLNEGLNFLQKPYHPQKLARVVRDCLDA